MKTYPSHETLILSITKVRSESIELTISTVSAVLGSTDLQCSDQVITYKTDDYDYK
jgi:hypothetical protein